MHNKNTSVSIIIPTYNERDNIHELLERIQRSMEPLNDPFEILIVDDDSPDETWKVASDYSNSYPVRVLRRKWKRGLATAVLEGIKASNYDIIVVMGADLQHPPETIPELLSQVTDGTDIAIGSRNGGAGVLAKFDLFGRIVSRGADLLARTLFRQIRNVKDIDSGFFAFHKDVIARANLNPVGDKILLEILVQGDYATVSEIAYRFDERGAGVRRPEANNAVGYLRHISSLFSRSGEFHRFLRFCAVGSVGAAVNLVVLYSLTESGVFYLLSGFIGIEAAVLLNFVLNRSWTFKDRGARGLRSVLTALYRDHAVRFVGIVLDLVILWILTSYVGVYYLLSQVIGIAVAMVWNYGGNQWWTWEPA
jgi:dolichol-phosphate mannosyltransferase